MKFFSSKNKGAISVFMTIIYLWVFILEAMLVDGGRMRLAEAEAEEAQQMANESVMALYNEALYQYYDLFGQTKHTEEAELTNIVKGLMETQLGAYSEGSAFVEYDEVSLVSLLQGSDYFDPFHFETKINDIGSGFNLGDEEVFKSQISDSMKYKGPVYLAQNFFDILGQMGGLKEVNDTVQESTEIVTKVYDEYGKYVESAKGVQKTVSDFLKDPTGEGHGDDLNRYARTVDDELTFLAGGYFDSICHFNSEIIDCRIDIYELEHDEDIDEDVQDDITALEEEINSLKSEKGALVDSTYKEAEEKINKYIETLKKINENIGEETSGGLLKDLKDLEDEASALVNNQIAPSHSTLENKKDNSTGEYVDDKKEIYGGFSKNLTKLHVDRVNPSIDANRKYREGLDEIKNSVPSVDDVESFLLNQYLPAFKSLLNKIRNDSRDYEDFIYVHEDEDEDEDDDWMEKYSDSDKYEIRDNKYVIPIQRGKDYTISTKFYEEGNTVNKYNKFIKSKTDKMESQNNKITDSLDGDKEKEKTELAKKEIDPSDSSSCKELLKDAGKSDDAEKMEGLSDKSITNFSPAGGHQLGKIKNKRNIKETPKKFDDVSTKKSSKDSVNDRTKMIDTLSGNIGKVLENGMDGLFECAYVMSYFRDYVHVGHMKKENLKDKNYDTVLNTKFIDGVDIDGVDIDGVDESNVAYLSAEQFKKIEVTCAEAEYVLYGMADTEKDVKAAYAEIFAVRLLLDYISVWITPEYREIVLKAASAAGVGAPLVIAALPLAFSVPRALADMTAIMTAKKCPLFFKEVPKWLTNTWNASDSSTIPMVGYGDYLLLFLLIDIGDTKPKRMQDVIETNMKKLDSNFSLDKAFVNLYVESECSINHLFMSEAFIPSKWRQDTRHKFVIKTNFSY